MSKCSGDLWGLHFRKCWLFVICEYEFLNIARDFAFTGVSGFLWYGLWFLSRHLFQEAEWWGPRDARFDAVVRQGDLESYETSLPYCVYVFGWTSQVWEDWVGLNSSHDFKSECSGLVNHARNCWRQGQMLMCACRRNGREHSNALLRAFHKVLVTW